MTTTYCTRLDIEAIIGKPALLATIDDNRNKVEDGTESTYITAAINRAAVEMNQALVHQFGGNLATALASNDWCKHCNAYIACWHLFARRSNPPPGSIIDAVQTYREQLSEIRWGRFLVPEAINPIEFTPTVTNFQPELGNPDGPIAVDTDQSTGAAPDETRKRNKARLNWN